MLDSTHLLDTSSETLLHSRYSELASNTIDYWMLPDDPEMTEQRVLHALESAEVLEDSSLELYIHVPFCAQHCVFCAFSGGNSLDFQQAERYSRLVVLQVQDLVERVQVKGRSIRSVNIGGGAPELLGAHIGHVLRSVRDLPGCSDETEISLELTLSTCKQEFIDELIRYGVTKVSFGIQSFDPAVRKAMRQPASLRHYDEVLGWINGQIPVVNADLITGLPGQSLKTVIQDQRRLLDDPRINCVSSYLLTAGAAPALLHLSQTGAVPPLPGPQAQALMRLHTYNTFLQEGWVRRGTNTYIDPHSMPAGIHERLAGNECIGASNYESFLLGAGPQAISSVPGARIENQVDIESWCQAMEKGEHPFHLPKCSTVHQNDMALWVFPLRWEGLPQHRYDRMLRNKALSEKQIQTLDALVHEGLVLHGPEGFRLSVVGEVFMGHLVRDLKKGKGRQAVDDYIAEGRALARAITEGRLENGNAANNRQLADKILGDSR